MDFEANLKREILNNVQIIFVSWVYKRDRMVVYKENGVVFLFIIFFTIIGISLAKKFMYNGIRNLGCFGLKKNSGER
jgi:hypothetical protein